MLSEGTGSLSQESLSGCLAPTGPCRESFRDRLLVLSAKGGRNALKWNERYDNEHKKDYMRGES